jgi:hypothetical protein
MPIEQESFCGITPEGAIGGAEIVVKLATGRQYELPSRIPYDEHERWGSESSSALSAIHADPDGHVIVVLTPHGTFVYPSAVTRRIELLARKPELWEISVRMALRHVVGRDDYKIDTQVGSMDYGRVRIKSRVGVVIWTWEPVGEADDAA